MTPSDFAIRVLADRTAALAARGTVPEAGEALPARLVCVAGGRHYGLAIGTVAAVLPFACHPIALVSAAGPAMLGVTQIGGQLASVLDLAGLMSGGTDVSGAGVGESGAGEGRTMLSLRGSVPPVAIRVDRVLGALRLRPADEPGHAMLEESGAAIAPLVMLVDAAMLQAAIAARDPAAGSSHTSRERNPAGV